MADLLFAVFVVGAVVPSFILVYGAYWAFQIRRALFVGVYRSQALWIGFFSLYFIPYVDGGNAGPNNLVYALLLTLYYIVLALLLFRLIDLDVRVARRSDPLLRDTLHWPKLRLVVWTLLIVGAPFLLAVTWLDYTGTFVSGQALAITQSSIYLPFLLSGVPALWLGARRSGDLTFRRNLKWMALFFVLLLVTSMAYFLETAGLLPIPLDLFNALGGITFVPAAYCLYRSAKSLAPLGHMAAPEA